MRRQSIKMGKKGGDIHGLTTVGAKNFNVRSIQPYENLPLILDCSCLGIWLVTHKSSECHRNAEKTRRIVRCECKDIQTE
jgi:hypothetical protein